MVIISVNLSEMTSLGLLKRYWKRDGRGHVFPSDTSIAMATAEILLGRPAWREGGRAAAAPCHARIGTAARRACGRRTRGPCEGPGPDLQVGRELEEGVVEEAAHLARGRAAAIGGARRGGFGQGRARCM